jgi:hypothetical protein
MHFGKHHHKVHAFTATITLIAVVLASSSGWSPRSYAATYSHNPIGVINYCTLSGSTTIIHGWAHDPDSAAGSNPKVTIKVGTTTTTVTTNLVYQDTAINKYLTSVNSSLPHSSKYGFTASFTGLYKGSSYLVNGTGINYGSGSNASLNVDTSAKDYDGIKLTTRLTSTKTLPDACLAIKPVTPTPPAPVPEPEPVPDDEPIDDAGDDGGDIVDDGSGDDGAVDDSGETPDVPGNANATVAAGTLSADISVPADGAQSAYILYGLSADTLDGSSDDVTVTGSKAGIPISGLQPKTKYYYQIVRTSVDGTITTSPTVSFDTAGYSVVLHLVDAQKKPVANIPGLITDSDNTSTKSDKNGDLKFFNLGAGKYTVKYVYNKLTYSKDFNTDSATDKTGKVAVLGATINVSALKSGAAAKKSSTGTILILLFFIIIIGGAIAWLVIRRRSLSYLAPQIGYNTPQPSANPVVNIPPPPIPQVAVPRQPNVAQNPELDHVGESLREMVVRSMHEEAERRKQGQ